MEVGGHGKGTVDTANVRKVGRGLEVAEGREDKITSPVASCKRRSQDRLVMRTRNARQHGMLRRTLQMAAMWQVGRAAPLQGFLKCVGPTIRAEDPCGGARPLRSSAFAVVQSNVEVGGGCMPDVCAEFAKKCEMHVDTACRIRIRS